MKRHIRKFMLLHRDILKKYPEDSKALLNAIQSIIMLLILVYAIDDMQLTKSYCISIAFAIILLLLNIMQSYAISKLNVCKRALMLTVMQLAAVYIVGCILRLLYIISVETIEKLVS